MAAPGMVIELDRTHAGDLNLAVLKRVDDKIESIEATASHVAMYSYSDEKKEWVSAARVRARGVHAMEEGLQCAHEGV